MLAECFKGHGTFIYDPKETLAKFGNDAAKLAAAVRQAGMRHAWVRLHDVIAPEPFQETQSIVQGLTAAGIQLAGWGWCHGRDPAAEAKLATDLLDRHGLVHYVADIEQGRVKGAFGASHWTDEKIQSFFQTFRQKATAGSQIFVSTFPYIATHSPELMQAAEPYVDGFAPQVYWFNYPAAWMWPRPELPHGASYTVNNPASYATLCLDMWRHYTQKPLLMTGQAYWSSSEGHNFDRSRAEGKLHDFLAAFTGWNRIAGINWWHFGHKNLSNADGAMSATMISEITAANLDHKPFATT